MTIDGKLNVVLYYKETILCVKIVDTLELTITLFFEISNIDDVVNKFLTNSLFNGEKLSTICNAIDWQGRKIFFPIHLKSELINEHLYIYKMQVHNPYINEFTFAASTQVTKLSFKEYVSHQNIQLLYNGQRTESGRMFAFRFEEEIGKNNYASLDYHIDNGNLEKLGITIFFENKCFFLDFSHLGIGKESMMFKLPILNIHHKYYIEKSKPWEYDNDALVTLCTQCHEKRYQQRKIPMYPDKQR